MNRKTTIGRRRFLGTVAGATITAPWIVPSSVLGRGGVVAPSERIILGGIGMRNRGGFVLSNLYVGMIASGLFLYLIGAIRRGKEP